MIDSFRLPIRLVVLAFAAVVIQQAAVSQISIFGVSADLAPLVVMSVGLLAGSLLLFAVLSLAMWFTRNLHRAQPA